MRPTRARAPAAAETPTLPAELEPPAPPTGALPEPPVVEAPMAPVGTPVAVRPTE